MNAGGDTNAAVACAILGAKYGYHAIPQEYTDGLLHGESMLQSGRSMFKIMTAGSIWNKIAITIW